MKVLLTVICILTAGIGQLQAQEAGTVGAGVVLGNPTGITGKFWLDGSKAVDAGIGFDSDISIYGDYLWHSWKVLPQPAQGKIPVYVGLGAEIGDSHHHDLGLRAVAGIAYWLPHDPLEIFFDIIPVFHFFHHNGTDLHASIGIRYYFGRQ